MERQTPFSLFVRQALMYPLTSPFLPAEDKVLKDFSYGAGKKIGTLVYQLNTRIWQPFCGPSLTFDNALIYAQYLEDDGITINENPQNIWQMPCLDEIVPAGIDSQAPGFIGTPADFLNSYTWSRVNTTEFTAHVIYVAYPVFDDQVWDKSSYCNIWCNKI